MFLMDYLRARVLHHVCIICIFGCLRQNAGDKISISGRAIVVGKEGVAAGFHGDNGYVINNTSKVSFLLASHAWLHTYDVSYAAPVNGKCNRGVGAFLIIGL